MSSHKKASCIHGGFISDKNSRASLRDILASRYLIISLISRDLKVRYHQTWLGWAWAVVNPAMHLSLYYAMFGMLVRLNTPDYRAPYSLVLLCGLLLWMLFSSIVNVVSESLLNNIHLIKKVYFPRIALTLASTGVCIMDFLIAFLLLSLALPMFGFLWPLWQIPLLLYCAVMTVICGWGVGCILAVARMRFRDVRHLIPLVILGGFYASPVTWTPVLLPSNWHWLSDLNPVAGCINLFRHVLLEGPAPSLMALVVIPIGSILMMVCGYCCFVYYESGVIDRE